jgi:rhamnulokinase
MANTYLAADFGAGSGRIMAGSIEEGMLRLEEVHRFANCQITRGRRLYWDFPSLFKEMKTGLRLAARKGFPVRSIGVDTWGVDFGLIDKDGNLLGNPRCYRDARTEGMSEKVFSFIDEKRHYETTGIQVMPINTLFQLFSMKESSDAQLEAADRLLFMPDLFSFFLTGVANNEYCIASTSELIDARKRTWDKRLIRDLGLPEHLFREIVQPGTIQGKLKLKIAQETELAEVEVIAVGSHDTASAVVAVPSQETPKAFLSSGTWSLLGVEIDEPIVSEKAKTAQFTNEGGVNGKICFLQNITGLWILQRIMAEWKANGKGIGYDEVISQASAAANRAIIPVDDKAFQNPESMENAIAQYCANCGMDIPQSQGDFVRCVLESLACRYQQAVTAMNRLLAAPIRQLHIIGGGSQNKLLNQLTANYSGIPVYAGPVEATAIGNILVQALAKGELSSSEEIKEIVLRSFRPQVYYPD